MGGCYSFMDLRLGLLEGALAGVVVVVERDTVIVGHFNPRVFVHPAVLALCGRGLCAVCEGVVREF